MKIKVLLSSVLSIVLCLTMIAGATYALFTDSETVNIAVTAGKVDIDVTVDSIQTTSREQNGVWDDDRNFTNGGLVTYDKAVANKVTLSTITPGDAVKLNLRIDNSSNVNIKYRVKVGLVSGVKLFQALNVSIDGVATNYKGMTFVSQWYDLDAVTETTKVGDVSVVIELPYLTAEEEKTLGISQNDLMGEGTELYYTVQAVQGNASAEDLDAVEAGVTYIYSPIDLQLFAENVNNGNSYKGETVQLMSDIDLTGINWTPIKGFQGTFDGKKTATTTPATYDLRAAAPATYVIKNLTVAGNSSVAFFANISGGALVQNVTFENATVYGNHYVGVVFGWEGSESLTNTVKNVHVVNSNVTCAPEQINGAWDNGDKAGAIGGYAVSTNIEGCTVTGTTVNAYRDFGGILGYAHKKVVVTNCVVENVTLNVNSTYNYKNYTSPVDFHANSIVGEAVDTAKIEGNDGEATIAKYTLDGVKYVSEGNEFVLDDAAAFTGNVYNIPEGVTTIDLKAFQKMTNLKNVTFPSTLKTVVNAAFLQSGLESVVIPGHVELQERLDGQSLANTFASCKSLTSVTLEEGITYLPSGCFQECYALKSVTIPSTVTSLAKKAFYDCLDLESVYLLSENCTIGAQAFSSNQTGKFSNMTIYVVNEAMKAAVEATLTDNNKNSVTVKLIGEQITPDESNPDAAQNALNAAVTEKNATVYVNAGEYTFPAGKIAEGVTIICAEGTVFEGNSKLNINGATVVGATFSNPTGAAADQTINGTFKDCTFYGKHGLRWCYAGDTVVFENCTFDGSTYGVHFDGGANKVKFVNCTISGFNAMGGEIEMLTMEGCTFKANGRSGYNGINLWGSAEMTDCTFVFDGTTVEWIDLCGSNKTATFTNCVVTDGTTEKDIATVIGDYGTGNTIIIDGAQVVTTTDALIAAINSNATKVLLAEGEYALRFTNNTAFNVDGMTIIGIGNVKISISSSEAWYGRIQGDDVTFENITFTSSVGCTGKATYNNCTFNGDWAICASSGMKETYFNDCTINATLNTSTDFSSGNVYVKNCTITKAEYSAPAATTLYFENSTIGELITYNANTVLTRCTVTTLDDSHMTTGTITIIE